MVTIPSNLKLIGDPHLGREFVHNVPLDRRGDREAMMMSQFIRELNEGSQETVVIVGDLFENPIISTAVLYQTIDALISASLKREVIIMAGNHDLDKATDRKGSFHVLAQALEYVPNVNVLFAPTIIKNVVYFPWQYDFSAIEQVEQYDMLPPTAIGHWDLESFGGSDTHLCPAQALKERGVQTIISGHWHVSGDYTVDGVPVYCTGSMQPMTHAEDPLGKLYVTLSKDEYEQADPKTFEKLYVRVQLEVGEEVSAPPTCLGFKIDKKASTKEVERVNMGTFDINDILAQAFQSFDVTKPIQQRIKENLNGVN